MKERIISVFLVLFLMLTMIPVSAFAADVEECTHHTAHDVDCGGMQDAGLCTYVCNECLEKVQAMINDLPDFKDIDEEKRDDVIEQLEAIDVIQQSLSDAARNQIDVEKYNLAAYSLDGVVRIAVAKRYLVEAGMETPDVAFAFYRNDEPVQIVNADGAFCSTADLEITNGTGSGEYYLQPGTYTVREIVEGSWNASMTVNGVAEEDMTFTAEAGDSCQLAFINQRELSITVKAVDAENENLSLRTNFKILDAQRNQVAQTEEAGSEHTFKGLNAGETYSLEAMVPDGYIGPGEITFQLNQDGTINEEETTSGVIENGILLVKFQGTKAIFSVTDNDVDTTLEGIEIKVLEKIEEEEVERASVAVKENTAPETVYGKLDPNGSYIARVTKVPAGYYLPEEKNFELEQGMVDLTFTLVADKVLPVISGVKDGEVYYTTQKITATDDLDENLDVTLNDGLFNGTIPGNPEEQKEYVIVAKDDAGNKASVSFIMNPISTLGDPIKDMTEENVKKEDRETIENVLEKVTGVYDNAGDVATQEEKQALIGIIEKAEALLDRIGKMDETPTLKNYTILEGNGSIYTKESGVTLRFRVDAEYNKFIGIKVDDVDVNAKEFDTASGSTVVTLKNDYLEGLQLGKHKITFLFKDGAAVGEFTVVKVENNNNSNDSGNGNDSGTDNSTEIGPGGSNSNSAGSNDDSNDSGTDKSTEIGPGGGNSNSAGSNDDSNDTEADKKPETGDDSAAWFYIGIMLSSMIAVAGLFVLRRKIDR